MLKTVKNMLTGQNKSSKCADCKAGCKTETDPRLTNAFTGEVVTEEEAHSVWTIQDELDFQDAKSRIDNQ